MTEMLEFLKTLADINRIRIIALLSERACSVEELAALLSIKPPTVSHHLAKLLQLGLVSAKADGYYTMYRLDKRALESRSRSLFSEENLAASIVGVDANAYDHKVIHDYSRKDGRLKTIPAQKKKLDAILRHVTRSFDVGKRYTEKKVNEILSQYHEDTASLRRELVGFGLMKRADGIYWREE